MHVTWCGVHVLRVYGECVVITIRCKLLQCFVHVYSVMYKWYLDMDIHTVQEYLLAGVIFGEFVCKKQLADFILAEFLQF